jgi:hypothetical protein
MWWRGARLPFLVWLGLFALILWAKLSSSSTTASS